MIQSEEMREAIARWTARQAEWSRLHVQVDGGAIADEVIADLARIAEGTGGERLTLTAASALSGYSTDHLSRLLRDGTIPNAGKKGTPRILRADVPIRPRRDIATARNMRYDVVTDARSLGGRR